MPSWPVSECPGKENETTFCDHTVPIKRNRSYHFLLLFRILYTSEEKQGNAPVCEKWNGEFRSAHRNKWTAFRGNPEYSGRNLSIWLPNEISGIVGTTGSTHSVRLIDLNGTQVHMYISPHVNAGTHLPLACSPCMVVILSWRSHCNKGPIVHRMDNVIHWITHYPVDKGNWWINKLSHSLNKNVSNE